MPGEEAKLEEAKPVPVPAAPATEAKLDDFIVLGRYTFIICMLGEFLILNQLGNMFYMMYAGAEPALTACGPTTFDTAWDAKTKCAKLAELQNRTNCEAILVPQFKSVNFDWGYYCANNKWVKQSVSIQMVGVIVGAIIFGQMSDSFGRKPALLAALTGCIATMFGSSFSQDLIVFTIIRFLVNVFNGGCIAVQLVFSVENLPKNDRFWITNIITWSPNIVVFALIAYLAGDWRTLTRASAVLAIPAIIILIFCCESPRFLLQRRQVDKLRAAIKRMYKIDGRTLDEALLDSVIQRETEAAMELQKKQKRYNYLHLFYTTKLARYATAVGFSLLTTSLITYSLLFNMEKLSGSIYMNSIIMGCFRYTLNLITAIADKRVKWLGRKTVHAIAEGFIMLALLFFITVYLLGMQKDLRLACSLAILSVMGQTTLLFSTNGVISSELFPTGIRNTSFSFGQVLSRIGVVLAPQLFFLADFWTPLPYFTLLALAIADFIFFHFNIDETKGKPLPTNMPNKADSWFHQRRMAKNRAANGEPAATELLPVTDEGNMVKDQ
ncbi:MFS domain-containing protein [Aphelenchoides bicaudatus]|nr:MFS domain-containing protein [Aphelenchoides bicaudatus]